MTNFRSWQFWVIIALALVTMACAGRADRRERREQAREDRRERLEQRRAERAEMLQQRRAQREQQGEQRTAEPAPAAAPAARPAATLTAVSAPAATVVADESSRMVFMRVSKQSGGVDASLFDVTEPGEPKFIGNVGSGSKLSYSLKPGLYTFMVVGETAEFMRATVVGGKTYYALVIPRAGARRFAIEPVRRNELGGKEFQGWDRGTKLMPGTPGAQANLADAAEKRVRYWPDWGKKPETQQAELTLNAEDGR